MPPRKQARNASAHKKRNRHRSKSQSADPYVTGKGKDGSCPIVGIGGSAGGFEAAMELLRHLPARTGMAFVIVQHLDPHHGSRLANLLGKATSMPVSEIAGTTTPEPNAVYVQPPNKCVIAKSGKLTLVRRTERLNIAIDHFFESLAEECGSRAIGIVLSGTGSDGTAGLRAIKAAGGLTFAQTEASAKFDAMPRSAIRSGFVDIVLPPDAIAGEIRRIADHPYIRRPLADAEQVEKKAYRQADDLGRIFLSLKKQMGVDFSAYKQSTLIRRVNRRMALHQIEELSHYARYLRNNKKEIEALFDDLLINVTRFFRDETLFRALKKRFLPILLRNKKKERQRELRVWVPGCATGEEVYSLAICILEVLGDELFKVVDKKNKIYTKEAKTGPRAADLILPRGLELSRFETTARSGTGTSFNADILKMADRIILSTYAPAAVVIDHNFLVQQFRGRTDLFLEHTPGPATLNLIQLARPNLVPDLRSTIRRAIKTDKPARAERAKVTLRGKSYEINIQVVPCKVPGTDKSLFLVIFDETTSGNRRERLLRVLGKASAQNEVTDLRRELAASKDSLQTIIEENEATNEELKDDNEEIESSNEELQSTNEELETAKEELQSTNEELTTLNEELSNRNLEMMQLTNELNNLLASTQMPIVMVDNALTVRRATPAARSAFNILPTDIGRPLSELRPNINISDLENILREVIETLGTRERKVTDKDGRPYSLRVRPYRTTDNKIDGAVLTLIDIDGAANERRKKSENKSHAK